MPLAICYRWRIDMADEMPEWAKVMEARLTVRLSSLDVRLDRFAEEQTKLIGSVGGLAFLVKRLELGQEALQTAVQTALAEFGQRMDLFNDRLKIIEDRVVLIEQKINQ